MEVFVIALLALLQGFTEFLPISSSGHLVVAQHLFRWTQGNVALDAALHLGTAISIIAVFRKDILGLIAGLASKAPAKRKASRTYAGWLIAASIPAGLAGVLFKDFFERRFLDVRTAGIMFFVSAAFLLASGLRKGPSAPLNLPKAVIVGLAQALAILPGISRSGSTISTALLLGTERKEAGRFSFLLGLPAILGASFLELRDLSEIALPPGYLALGIALSAVTGFFALNLLLKFVERGRLHIFGYYLIVLGLLCLIFL